MKRAGRLFAFGGGFAVMLATASITPRVLYSLDGKKASRAPSGQASGLVGPKFRFGKGRLFVPREIRASGGEVWVLDEVAPMTPGDEKIVVFSADGKWKAEFGSRGQGPGEFGQAHAFDVRDGKVFVLDSFRQCIHIFDAATRAFIRSVRYGSEQSFTTPTDFAVLEDGGYVLCRPRGVRGDKILFRIGADGKPAAAFLDCLPVYETMAEMYAVGNSRSPEMIRKDYANLGYLDARGKTIYFLSWLSNAVLELSFDGAVLGRQVLPLPSLEKTVKIVKEGAFSNIERRLNYGLQCGEGRVWVLSRSEAGESILYEIGGGRIVERLRAKEPLAGFWVEGETLYGLDVDAGEVLAYPLPSGR